MPLNYHLQELPNLQEGGKKHFPKLDTYTAFNNNKMVKRIAYSKGHLEEYLVLLQKWVLTHDSITLQEYSNLTGLSTSTASRELKIICPNPDNGNSTSGKATRKIWVKS